MLGKKPTRAKCQIICEHKLAKHYAKGFCKNCYQKFGKGNSIGNNILCKHKNGQYYANGKCKQCYLKSYYLENAVNYF